MITPHTPIPDGHTFTVTVSYTGTPGAHHDGDGSEEGWFRDSDGNWMATEPVGSEDWMPLNDHPSAKPTYDFSITTDLSSGTDYCAEIEAQNDMGTDGGKVAFTTAGSPDDDPTYPGDGCTDAPPSGPGHHVRPRHHAQSRSRARACDRRRSLDDGIGNRGQADARLPGGQSSDLPRHRHAHGQGPRHHRAQNDQAHGRPRHREGDDRSGARRTVIVALNAFGRKLSRSHNALTVRLSATQNGKSLSTRTLKLSAPKRKHE